MFKAPVLSLNLANISRLTTKGFGKESCIWSGKDVA